MPAYPVAFRNPGELPPTDTPDVHFRPSPLATLCGGTRAFGRHGSKDSIWG
jgi:hypothetical protein